MKTDFGFAATVTMLGKSLMRRWKKSGNRTGHREFFRADGISRLPATKLLHRISRKKSTARQPQRTSLTCRGTKTNQAFDPLDVPKATPYRKTASSVILGPLTTPVKLTAVEWIKQCTQLNGALA